MTLTRFISIAALTLSFSAQSAQILIDTTKWTESVSPSSDRLSNENWVQLHDNAPKKQGNSSGALISDFTLGGDFTFSGIFTPTFAYNASCQAENTCDDDDILGLVFGWQDANNHYRLGWSQGDGSNSSGVKDVTGKTGLFLVKEENGRSNTIKNWDSSFWLEDVAYKFSISRVADSISLSVQGLIQSIRGIQGAIVPTNVAQSGTPQTIDYSVSDSTFVSGRVGIYTESQTAEFKSLAVNVPSTAVNVVAPATASLAILGGLGLLVFRLRTTTPTIKA